MGSLTSLGCATLLSEWVMGDGKPAQIFYGRLVAFILGDSGARDGLIRLVTDL